jgi:hypothetical protein
MAKLNLMVDTDDHSLSAQINGTPIGLNVDNISVYNFGTAERPRFTFQVGTRDVADDVVVRTHIEASLAPIGSTQASIAPDLRVHETRDESDAARQLAAFIGANR